MRVLLDECVDRRLAAGIQGHDVKTGPEAGWAGLKNGDLSSRAQHEFDILVTTDRNLPFQQDLSRFSIAIIVLRASRGHGVCDGRYYDARRDDGHAQNGGPGPARAMRPARPTAP